MSSPIATLSSKRTKKEFLDFSRPLFMEKADSLFKTLMLKKGSAKADIINTLSDVSSEIRKTKSFELDLFWGRLEKKLNKGRPLNAGGKTDLEKLEIAYSLFYNALNELDEQSATGSELNLLKNAYTDTRTYVENKFRASLTGKDKNMFDRATNTMNNRFKKVIGRYNTRVENGEIQGRKISAVI